MKTVWYESGEDYTPCAEVRKTVFIDEQGYLPEEEFDEADKTCPHLAIFDGETPVAAGRLVLDGRVPHRDLGMQLYVLCKMKATGRPEGYPSGLCLSKFWVSAVKLRTAAAPCYNPRRECGRQARLP